MSERVVVVGAGVIGLLTARELALAGLRVTLVERARVGVRHPGREAGSSRRSIRGATARR
ncbi:FAD-dependent oxidoreductase [Pseudomonas aeruginosa]|nr:FAD-dependent oxidoreductase [Pseudomonas aeruginosa]